MATLRWTKADFQLISSVRSLRKLHTDWSTSHPEIQNYRNRLLELQNKRCVYCLGPIESTANGYLELDHILPKLPNGSDPKRLTSLSFDDRKVTKGYCDFTYEPKNLVVACRACNTAKGSFDPCNDRTANLDRYPSSKNVSDLIIWYHPHFQEYDDHIERTPEWTFKKRTDQGDFTIRACKLDIPEELQKRFQARADANLAHSPTARVALLALAVSILTERYGLEQAISALVDRCQLTRLEARELMGAFLLHAKSSSLEYHMKAEEALRSVAIIWEGKEAFLDASDELQKIANASKPN